MEGTEDQTSSTSSEETFEGFDLEEFGEWFNSGRGG